MESADAIEKKITKIEEALYQTKNRSGQDPLNFPIRLNNKLANLVGQVSSGDFRPTDQAYAFKKEITAQIDEQLSQLKQVKEQEIPALNKMIQEKNVNFISVEKKEQKATASPTSSVK